MSTFIEYTDFIFSCLMSPIICMIGFISNLLCFVIFLNDNFKKTMYFYLKIEALFVCLNLFIGSFKPLNHCTDAITYGSYISSIYFIYMINFFLSVLENSAFICRNISLYEFYLLVANKKPSKHCIITRVNYKLVSIIIFLFSFFLFIYQIFEFEIKKELKSKGNVSAYDYGFQITNFSKSDIFKINQIIAFTIRDFLNLFIMIYLNISIYLKLLKSMKNKIEIQKSNAENAKNAINSTKLMVFLGSLNYVIGRIPIAVYSILNTQLKYSEIHLLTKLAVVTVNLSYSIHFILYITTNKIFKRVFLNYIKCKFFN